MSSVALAVKSQTRFHDAPPSSMPDLGGMQRARGEARLVVASPASGETKLVDLRQSGCLKMMLPKNHASVPDAVLVNTAGGVTAGDRLAVSVAVDAGASLRLATQTAERFYRAKTDDANTGDALASNALPAAAIEAQVQVGQNALLHWLPQESILFDGSKTQRTTRFDMASNAHLVAVDSWVLGRVAMGEQLNSVTLADTRSVWIDGQLRLHDRLVIDDAKRLGNPFVLGSNRAFAIVWMVGDQYRARLESARELGAQIGLQIGAGAAGFQASLVNGCLVARFAAADPRHVREGLGQWLTAFSGQALPRVWTM